MEQIFTRKRTSQKRNRKKIYTSVDNRQREIWFSYAGRVIDQDLDFGQGTGEEIWYLNYKGRNLEVRLFKPPYLEFQGFLSDKKTYKRTWRFLSVTPESLDSVSNKELRDIIKEALDIYGESGISSLVDRKNVELILENF